MHIRQDVIYNVVINLQGKYSIWPKCKDIPLGWRMVGTTGTRQECLDLHHRHVYGVSALFHAMPPGLKCHQHH